MITRFSNEYRFLSNFEYCKINYEGKEYPSVEHAYQAAKSLDPLIREQIRLVKTPKEAKQLGQKIDIRPDWNEIKLNVMSQLVLEKFTSHCGLAQKLLYTGHEELVEGNWWGDTFWGICNGKGENHLGKILMRVRDQIRILNKCDF